MKEASEIYRDMLAAVAEKTGFSMSDSADLAVRLYAAAAEIESLYAYCDWALGQSFPQTANGEYLDLHAALRGLGRREAAKAKGSVRFSLSETRTADLTVPAGTVCATAGLVRFVTTEDAVIAAGELSAAAAAESEEAGGCMNAAANTVTEMPAIPTGVSSVTNPAAFAGGCDGEDDEALRARILESFVRLPNGANAAFYESRVRAAGGVGGVEILPRVNGRGTVGVVVASESGESDNALLTRIDTELSALREIGVDVTVSAPTVAAVDPAVTIWPAEGVTFAEAKAAAETALAAYFDGSLLGKPVYLARLGAEIYKTGKVANYVVTAPSADIAAASGTLPVLGTLTVTEGA